MRDPLTRGVDRQTFLTRVTKALAALPGAAADPLEPAPAIAVDARSREEIVTEFSEEASAADATLARAGSLSELREQIVSFLAAHEHATLVRADTPLIRRLELDRPLQDVGVSVIAADARALESRDSLRAATERSPVGLTEVDWAISETGTLAILHRPGQGRAVSLLPSTHLAILPTSRILPDIGAVLGRLAPGELPSAVTFITGPSRTADVEMVIIKGVHGPRELHVILFDDSGDPASPSLKSRIG
ncbi:MAG: hypothetical protein GY725_14465 [bacterium]|nr:hypothetical protein [bacterium]